MVIRVDKPELNNYIPRESGQNNTASKTDMLPGLLAGGTENADNTKMSQKAETAQKNGYKSTPNANIYCDDNNKYYQWDEKKHKFQKMKDVAEVFSNGWYKYTYGTIYDPNGRLKMTTDSDGRIRAFTDQMKYSDSGPEVFKRLCEFNGYEKKGELNGYFSGAAVSYDKTTNEYKRFSGKTQDFDVIDMVDYHIDSDKNLIYKTSDNNYIKIFNPKGENKGQQTNISEEEYYAVKGGYEKYDKYENAYRKLQSGYYAYYKYNSETKTFDEYSQKIDQQNMLDTKADGKIDHFRQNDLDCWLVTVPKTLFNEYVPENVKDNLKKALESSLNVDDKGNVTVEFKGHRLPNGKTLKYTITNEKIDNVIKNGDGAIGDKDMVAIELAVSQYTDHAFNNNYYEFRHNKDGLYGETVEENYWSGDGEVSDTIGLLTGMQSTTITKDGSLVNTSTTYRRFRVNENVKKEPLDEAAIKKYMENNVVYASYKTGDSAFGKNSGHVVSLAKIDEEYVWYLDTNIAEDNPDKTPQLSKMKKDEFFEKLTSITYTDFSTPIKDDKTRLELRSKMDFGI